MFGSLGTQMAFKGRDWVIADGAVGSGRLSFIEQAANHQVIL